MVVLSGLWLVVIVHMGSSEDRGATQGLDKRQIVNLLSLVPLCRNSVTLGSHCRTQHTKKTVTLIRPPPLLLARRLLLLRWLLLQKRIRERDTATMLYSCTTTESYYIQLS